MVEWRISPRHQAITNAELVLAEVPPAMQADINPLAELSKAIHIKTDPYGKPFTDEELTQLRKTRDTLLNRLGQKYPDQSVMNIADALAVRSLAEQS